MPCDVLGGLVEPAVTPVQGAYGIMAEVESHPFATDAMLFMDWRDDHTTSDPEMQESNRYAKITSFRWDAALLLPSGTPA